MKLLHARYIHILCRSCISTLLLIGICLKGYAQNNPYKIDDRIYPYFVKVDDQANNPVSLLLSDSIIQLAKKYKDKKAEVLAYTIPVEYYTKHQDVEKAQASAQQLKDIAQENNYMQYYYYAYSLEGRVLLNSQRFAEAINLLGMMRSEATTNYNAYGLYFSYIGLGHVYHAVYNHMEAETMYVMAAELVENEPELSDQTSAGAWLNAGVVAMKSEQYSRASNYFSNIINQSEHIQIKASALAYRTVCQYMLGQTENARKDYEYHIQLEEEMGNNTTGRTYLAHYTNAMLNKDYQTALDIAISISDFSESALLSIECYKRMGNYEQALKTEQEKRRTIQKRLSEYMQTNAALLGSLLQTQNDSLKVSNLQLELAQRNLALILVLIVMFASVAYMVLRVKSASALKDTNKKLVEANKKAEENLTTAEKNLHIAEENKLRAERSEQMKTMFIQNMSHEIRTPLNAIVGFSQLLTDPEVFENLSHEERKDFMDLITNNSNLLTKLVNDILNLSDLQSGKYKMALSQVSVNETCKICLMNMDLHVPENVNLYYTSELPDNYMLYTDQQRMQQVLYNLLTNACKYTSEGEIHVHASLKENLGYVTISVADTGKGIPADKAESIFDRFEKLDSFVQGTGLGLSICRIIASIMHGEVKLDTTYTAGARFVFMIPEKA